MMPKSQPPDLIIATGNSGKFRELSRPLLAALPLRLGNLADFPRVRTVDEHGSTFRENAELKALGYAAQLNRLVLADDSGLEVDALGGAPGVYSARYGGAELSDAGRVALLLQQLGEVEDARRTARFVCVIAVAGGASQSCQTWQGVCEGEIARRPTGDGGFGYDPVFVPRGHRQTFAELPAEIKQSISHRALALAAAMPFLARLCRKGT